MDTLIHTSEINPAGTSHVYAAAGKVSAYVSAYRDSSVTVCCLNAASRRLSVGRTFHGAMRFEEALAAYKSAEMKAIIEAARDLITGDVSFDHPPANLIQFSTH
jgi:hypothetical protein